MPERLYGWTAAVDDQATRSSHPHRVGSMAGVPRGRPPLASDRRSGVSYHRGVAGLLASRN